MIIKHPLFNSIMNQDNNSLIWHCSVCSHHSFTALLEQCHNITEYKYL